MTLPAAEQSVYQSFDRERGARLARLVSIAFGSLFALIALGMLVALLIMPSLRTTPGISVWGIFTAGTLGYALAHRLAVRDAPLASALLIIGSADAALAGAQLAHGVLDGIVAVLFGMNIILVALSGVLVDATFMFGTAAALTIVGAAVSLLLMRQVTLTTAVIWFTASAALWIAALLVYGAQLLYMQTLHELGDLRMAVERAQKLDDLKNQFIRGVNHELRNPIMAWYSCAELLQQAGDGMETTARRELIDRSVTVGKRVLALLRSILDVPRLDEAAADFTPQPVAVAPLIREALTLLDPAEAGQVERAVELRLVPDLAIWGDAVRLQEILVNLLSNALKYSAPGTPILIHAQPDVDEMIVITVRDYGLGIPPGQIALLFERFVRLPRDLASSVVGNGLGLYLCRRLAEAMGGSIRAESTGVEGEGTTFHLLLPSAHDQFSPN